MESGWYIFLLNWFNCIGACLLESITYFLMAHHISTVPQEVNRLLTGLNCGKVLESIALPESATALSVEHGFDLQV